LVSINCPHVHNRPPSPSVHSMDNYRNSPLWSLCPGV
jgi:hypothetical protein